MSATTCIISLLLLNFLYAHVRTNEANVTETSVQLYEKGVEAYLENRWEDCVDYFEKALSKYGKYRKKVQRCRLQCKNEAELSEPLYPVNIDNLLFFERAIRQTLCIIDCENDDPEILDNYINLETGNLFEEQRPYEYLHICYFQTKNIVKAASSAFTYLVAHPDNKIMANNLKHYLDQNVDKKDIVNYEAKDYVYLYVHGSEAYEYKDWDSVIFNMEESLTEYLQAEDECRAQCEGPFDHGWYPDFIPSISNHFTVCLKCKQKCRKKLSSLNGEIHDDLLPSHYHYLQYAYYKTGNLRAACAAVASYLTFYPDDDTMLENMRYYSKLPKVQNDYFQPREEAIRYVQRQIYESRLLKFVHNEFSAQSADTAKTEELKRNLHVIMSEKVLKGSKRMVLDGLATSKECKTLIEIAKYFALLGDGYEGRKSPHTIMETFEGITLSRTLFLTYFKMLRPKYLDVFLKITNAAKKYIKNYFKIKKKLYFSFTHLVCRTALPGSSKNRTDFSHKIHADNCVILKNKTCIKSFPAFTWRDYSAILYLNDDFDGGEFVFSSDPVGLEIQSSIKPRCGRLVAFSSGPENLHGVTAVKTGSRCAIGIWLTHDEKYADEDRNLAQHILDNNLDFYLDPSTDITQINPEVQNETT